MFTNYRINGNSIIHECRVQFLKASQRFCLSYISGQIVPQNSAAGKGTASLFSESLRL